MKTLTIILTLAITLPLFAEQKKDIQKDYAKRDAELRRELVQIEHQMLLLASRLSTLQKKLDPDRPVGHTNGEILIDVLADGHVTVDKDKMSKKELKQKLQRISTTSKDVAVRIRGNSKVEYQTIIEIIDLCQKVGIHNISFATQKQEK